MSELSCAIRICKVAFSCKIEETELPAFRGAIVALVGKEKQKYHNHNDSPNAKVSVDYGYPKIQYRIVDEKAEIWMYQDACKESSFFERQPRFPLRLYQRNQAFEVASIDESVVEAVFTPGKHHIYTLSKWIPLNDENYNKYKELSGLSERIEMLQKMLQGQILSFATGMGWVLPEKPMPVILDFLPLGMIDTKPGLPEFVCNVEFKVEMLLPANIALGKHTAWNRGVLSPAKKNITLK